MDQTVNYADILTQVIHEESKLQPSFQPRLKIVSSCDKETGQFLLIIIGWDKDAWVYNILFHAQLIDGKVIIEIDGTEDLKSLLIEAGIRPEDLLSDRDRDRSEAAQVAARSSFNYCERNSDYAFTRQSRAHHWRGQRHRPRIGSAFCQRRSPHRGR